MTLSHRAIGAIFLSSVIGLWRFQIGAGGTGVPIYLMLTIMVIVVPIPTFMVTKTFLIAGSLVSLMLLALVSGVHLLRPSVSIIALFMMLIAMLAAATSIQLSVQDGWVKVSKGLKFILRIQIALQFVQIAGLNPLGNRSGPHYFLPIDRPSGLLIEPSHVAITLSPLILASLWPRAKSFGGQLTKWDFVLVYLAIFLCPSATMINVIFIAICLRICSAWPVLGITFFFLLAVSVQNFYTIVGLLPGAVQERFLDLVTLLQSGYFDQQSNLSSVVFYGGYVAARTTLEQYPFGIGFLNMASIYSTDALSLYRQVVGDSNINDGSSLLFKLATEFGYLGIGFAIYSSLSIWRYFAIARPDITVGLLAFPTLAYFSRGASYLDGPVVVALAVVIFGFHNLENPRFSSNEQKNF